ncbi:MAG: branched-chain amino acid ABC transporter permease [Rhodospirillaceae bacterium]|nr:branched-chain amino acid ABC transporter permease [Rhodospirillaceae bacterium]
MNRRAQQALGFAAAIAALGLLGLTLDGYALRLLTLALLNIITVVGLNFAFGYCGVIHLGQAAFVGIGAYFTALLTTKLGWPMALTMPAGVIAAGLFALVVSAPLVRLKGHYLALATVGVNVILELVARNWVEVTNGFNGVTGIPRLADAVFPPAPERAFLAIAGATALVAVWLALRVRDSHLGRAMIAVRDDETAAATCGIDATRTKVIAFALSAVFGGVSGVLFAHYTGFVSPTDFAVAQSILVLVMLVIGGEGRIMGAVVGALALTFLPEILRDLQAAYVGAGGSERDLLARLLKDGYLAVYGLITLAVLMLLPRGLAGLGARLRKTSADRL